MLVELRGLADDRHHAVGPRELEERVDVGVREPLREQAQTELRLQFGSKARLPCRLVRLKRRRVKAIGA